MIKRYRAWAIALGLCGLVVQSAHAQWDYKGLLKYQPSVRLYQTDDAGGQNGERVGDQGADLRLMATNRSGRWDLDVHYQASLLAGDSPAQLAQTLDAGLMPDDRRRLLDLTMAIVDDRNVVAVHRLDRLSLGYGGRNLVLRLGRQAVSWGNGFVYNPMDIFNPFAPAAVITDYKSGDDMAYAQWLLPSGDDWQMILLPRRDLVSRKVEMEESSLAIKLHTFTRYADINWLVARHYGENLLGLGAAANVAQSVWRMDVTMIDLRDGGYAGFFTTNLDYSWVAWAHNVYGFIELHYNSLGQDEVDLSTLRAALTARLERGESFALGRRYWVSGVQIELAPLVNFSVTAIVNVADGSAMLPLRLNYDWRENLTLSGGANLAMGKRNSEFGGLALPSSGLFASPGQLIYARLNYYF